MSERYTDGNIFDGILGAALDSCAPDPSPVDDGETKRKRKVPVRRRPYTESIKRIGKGVIERGRMEYPESETALYERPTMRAQCRPDSGTEHAQRPCPWAGCKFNLYLDVNPRTGSIKYNHPDTDLADMQESCVLDLAERGGMTLEEVGEWLAVTRERARQLETRGIAKLKALDGMSALSDYANDTPFDVWRMK